MSEHASGATPHIVPQMGKGHSGSLYSQGGAWKGGLPVIGELMSDGFICDQGNCRGMPLTVPLIRVITSWSLGQVCRMVSHRIGVCEVGTSQAGM